MKVIEFRDRTPLSGGIRIFLGRAAKRTDLRVLAARRELLKRLAKRGEYDVLRAIAGRVLTVEHLERLVDQYGVEDYRRHLVLRAANGLPTLQKHAERWLDTIQKQGTRRTYRVALGYLMEWQVEGERLGDRSWAMIAPHHVKDAQAALFARYARATVQTATAAWSAFYDWAIRREESEAGEAGREPAITVNPVRKAASWVVVHPTRQRFLRHDEFESLLAAAPGPMRAQYATLTLCGLRGGELRNLPVAHVHPTHVHVAPWGRWAPKGYPRSARGVRDVPVHPTRLRPLLEEYREEHQAAGEMYFTDPRTGEPWTEGAFRRQFYADASRAGLVTGTGEDGVSPHTCRHTFASWLAQADVQLIKIAQLMGDTVETVQRYYAHLLPSDLDETVLRLF